MREAQLPWETALSFFSAFPFPEMCFHLGSFCWFWDLISYPMKNTGKLLCSASCSGSRLIRMALSIWERFFFFSCFFLEVLWRLWAVSKRVLAQLMKHHCRAECLLDINAVYRAWLAINLLWWPEYVTCILGGSLGLITVLTDDTKLMSSV